MNLFNKINEPLSSRLKPDSLKNFFGQEHILGENKILRKLIIDDKIKSLIIFGPPGTGKSLLAHIIAKMSKSAFISLNAVTSNVNDIRETIKIAKQNLEKGIKTILFIDEIHRFNKLQQDALLPYVEDGTVTLIGATTTNPYFYIVPALQSRSHIFEFKPLNENALLNIINYALTDSEKGLGKYNIIIDEDTKRSIIKVSKGDARKALNILEMAFLINYKKDKNEITINRKSIEEILQQKINIYDKDGNYHYDVISAFIKSIRGSDPDAAIYWLARMLDAGEDIRFIARRLVILASEDIGNADPIALILAQSCFDAVNHIGMPEARIILAHTTTYLASAPKSNSSYIAIEKALNDIKNGKILEVPEHLRDTHFKSAEKLKYGENYKYPHDYKYHYVKQEYIPEKLTYYSPGDLGYEKKIKDRLNSLKKIK